MPNISINPLRGITLILLHGTLLAMLCLAGAGCLTEDEAPEVAITDKPRVPKEQFFDYELIETSDGIRQWRLESNQMLKFSDQEDVLLITVNMDFYRGGEHFSVLTADSGEANLMTKDVHTWGNVVVVTDDGRRLETEELFFSNETELIHNEVFNTFTRGQDVVTGIGLEATPDLEYIEIKQQVVGNVLDQATEDDR